MSLAAIGDLTLYQVRLLCMPEEKLRGVRRTSDPAEAKAIAREAKAKRDREKERRDAMFRMLR